MQFAIRANYRQGLIICSASRCKYTYSSQRRHHRRGGEGVRDKIAHLAKVHEQEAQPPTYGLEDSTEGEMDRCTIAWTSGSRSRLRLRSDASARHCYGMQEQVVER